MKYLEIDNGRVFFFFDESGKDKKPIDLITKDDILKLIQRALDDDKFEMDPYDDTLVQNAAHKVIYKNIYQKLDDLLKRRISFNDERAGLYRTAINAYSHDQNLKYNRNPFQFIKSFWISGFILGGSTGTTNNYASADAGVKVR